MNLFQAILLGVVQGVSEFFPISSSAHLRFVRSLLGIPGGEEWLYFDLACHAGTWLALLFFLRKEVFHTLRSPRQIAIFSFALLPLVPAYFLLKPLRVALSSPSCAGYFLLATALLLFLARRPQTQKTVVDREWRDVLFIGGMQAMALLPGLSRSGSTISAGRFCGWSWLDSARFSFLLAIPTIFGGEVLESWKHGAEGVDWTLTVVGFTTSLAVGLVTVRWVFRIYERGQVLPFAWYCLGAGLLMIVVMHG